LPGERAANVYLNLAEPLRRQMTWAYLDKNGTATLGSHFKRTQGRVTFQPGETEKVITVPILKDLGAAEFVLEVGWSENQPPVPGAIGKILGGTSRPSRTPVVQVTYNPPAQASGRAVVLDENFLGPISPDAVKGLWRTRPAWGRVQTGNKEVAPYADKTTDPGVDPHPIVNGVRTLTAGVGNVWDEDTGKNYAFYAPMLMSDNYFLFDEGYLELDALINAPRDSVPAFWFATGEFGKSSYKEVDIFEDNLGGTPGLRSTVHGPFGAEGVALGFLTTDGKYHRYGFDCTPAWYTTLIDDKVVHRRPNPFPGAKFPVILNIGMGGALGPSPPLNNPAWKSEMAMKSLRWWK
jgi:hypothetical protein